MSAIKVHPANSVMPTWAIATTMLAAMVITVAPVGAQERITRAPTSPEPELAVAAYLGRTATIPFILDPRELNLFEVDGKEFGKNRGAMAQALAGLMRAKLIEFEHVVTCRARTPSDGPVFGLQLCSMPSDVAFLGISGPAVVGDLAEVYVTEWRLPAVQNVNHPTITQYKYTLQRSGRGWTVISRRVEAST